MESSEHTRFWSFCSSVSGGSRWFGFRVKGFGFRALGGEGRGARGGGEWGVRERVNSDEPQSPLWAFGFLMFAFGFSGLKAY